MLVLGLTGGIGSGKSTVAALLAARGAVVIDADVIARDVVAPGTPAHGAVVERFGPAALAPDGAVDRRALAAVVFADPVALADLNRIVHPAVGGVIDERLEQESRTDHVVVLDVPLLVESGAIGFDALLVVDCPEELAIARVVGERGMEEADARRRVAAQASREERLARADRVIRNDRSPEDLEAQVAEVWTWVEHLRARREPPAASSGDAGAGGPRRERHGKE